MSQRFERHEGRDIMVYCNKQEAKEDADLFNSLASMLHYEPQQLQIQKTMWWVVRVTDTETGEFFAYL